MQQPTLRLTHAQAKQQCPSHHGETELGYAQSRTPPAGCTGERAYSVHTPCVHTSVPAALSHGTPGRESDCSQRAGDDTVARIREERSALLHL